MIPAHIEHTFRALDRIERRDSPALAATVDKSLSHDKNEAPTAGIGTADAGTPIVRYWTVKYRHEGSRLWDYAHVIACDPFKASLVVTNRDRSIAEAVPVREIQRDEFEHLTKVSP